MVRRFEALAILCTLAAASVEPEASCDRWARARQLTRSAFLRGWRHYELHAFGKDEVLPLTNGSRDNWSGLAITMVDSLDTMLLMGLDEEYGRARDWLVEHLPAKIAGGGAAPFFEVTIRGLGGLLGAHTLSRDPAVLRLAELLGRALLPALSASASGVPYCTVALGSGEVSCPASELGESIPLSELGSVQLEFAALAEAVGDPAISELADAAISALRRLPSRAGLLPSRVRPRSGGPASKEVGFGSGSDSFYETLLKRWLQSGGADRRLLRMYRASLVGLEGLLRRSHPSRLLFLSRRNAADVGTALPRSLALREQNTFEHLTCFVPGMLALGAATGAGLNATREWEVARELLHTCAQLYSRQPAGLGPERVAFVTEEAVEAAQAEARARRGPAGRPGEPASREPDVVLRPPTDYDVLDSQWPLRPEFAESLFVMHALDPEPARRAEHRARGEAMLTALLAHCEVAPPGGGLAGLRRTDVAWQPRQANLLESFFFSETAKYLYLLFSEPSELPHALDLGATHVLTTEAHVLPARVGEAAQSAAAISHSSDLKMSEQDERAAEAAGHVFPRWW